MSRTLHCANVHALGSAHSHIRQENDREPAASAGLAEKTSRTLGAQSTPYCAAIVRAENASTDSESLHCANVHALGSAHSHIRQESRTTACTLPAQNSLKAAASAVLARTLPRTLPAQSEEKPRTLGAQSTPYCAGNVQRLSADFKLVVTWWEWSPEDVETFTAWAKQNRAEASAWVHQEAAAVRDRQDRLYAANITEFIKDRD